MSSRKEIRACERISRVLLSFIFILSPNLVIMDHLKNESLLYAHPLDDSTLNRAYTAATAFLGEWLILLLTCSIALFFIPLTPAFTLHSTSASVLNITQNHLTVNLTVGFLIQDSNPMGTTINYHSFHVSLFHNQQTLSNFSIQDSFQQQEMAIKAKFPNVSLTVDEWRVDHGATQPHGTSCGLAHVDLWFTVNATHTWPTVRDTLQGRCGEVKFELCSSAPTSFLQSCDVDSTLVHRVRLVLLALLILLLVTATAVPLIVQKFFCSQS